MMAFVTHSLVPSLASRSRARVCSRRRTMRMQDPKPEQAEAEVVTPAGEETAQNGIGGMKMPNMPPAPSFDTSVFTDFVDSAQEKVDDLVSRAQEVNPEELVDETKTSAFALIDNFLAGDWLNRGELYGAVQLVFVLLL
eukprot:IDg14316t1